VHASAAVLGKFVYMDRVRFLSGFVAASILWGGLFFSYLRGGLDFLLPVDEPAEAAAAVAPVEENAGPPSKGKRRGVRRPRLDRRAPASAGSAPNGANAAGNSTTGDDLGWDKERNVDMNGGEGGLTGSQIDAGFDSMMGRIRRCLILVPSDGEVTGKLVFGMRVGSDGKPRAVNLSGPSIVTGGESGSCLRSAAQGIQFASFNGPDTLFKYPITLQ
jgi:hypothetical protein